MKSLVRRIIAHESNAHECSLDEIDISSDPELLDRYGLEIPVLVIDGKKVAKYRVSEAGLTQMLEARRGS